VDSGGEAELSIRENFGNVDPNKALNRPVINK
jgi:hypothetical protein